MDILEIASQFSTYRELFPGEYAGPCPACGGAMRFRIRPASGTYVCTYCGINGDRVSIAALFSRCPATVVVDPATPPEPPAPSTGSRQYLTATGRTMTVAYDRETFLALAGEGTGAFTPKELEMVTVADVPVEVDELLLDIKEAFPGAWLKQIEKIEEVTA